MSAPLKPGDMVRFRPIPVDGGERGRWYCDVIADEGVDAYVDNPHYEVERLIPESAVAAIRDLVAAWVDDPETVDPRQTLRQIAKELYP